MLACVDPAKIPDESPYRGYSDISRLIILQNNKKLPNIYKTLICKPIISVVPHILLFMSSNVSNINSSQLDDQLFKGYILYFLFYLYLGGI